MKNESVTVIIPAFEESESIGNIVGCIRQRYPDFEIIVVDDGSTDDTASVAFSAGATVVRHPYNIGNGAAVKTGIREASGDILVFLDADGQHDPEDIARLLEPIPKFDMVVGARMFKDQATVGRAMGNICYNWLASYVAKFQIRDLTSGFRAVKSHVAKSFVYLLPNTYSYPTTITLGVLRSGLSIRYVPIKVRSRTKGTSNIRLFRDGVRFFMIITRICTLFSPMRVFLPVCFFMFSSGILNYIYTFFTQGRFTNMSALLIVASIIIFMMSLVSEQICQMRYERRAHDPHRRSFPDHRPSDE
jgi:glycosyltransferase involved in cell wall biosynthesis